MEGIIDSILVQLVIFEPAKSTSKAAIHENKHISFCFRIVSTTLHETNSSPLKWMVGIRSFPLGWPIFTGYVSFREGNGKWVVWGPGVFFGFASPGSPKNPIGIQTTWAPNHQFTIG